jgi:hypothetical protein
LRSRPRRKRLRRATILIWKLRIFLDRSYSSPHANRRVDPA